MKMLDFFRYYVSLLDCIPVLEPKQNVSPMDWCKNTNRVVIGQLDQTSMGIHFPSVVVGSSHNTEKKQIKHTHTHNYQQKQAVSLATSMNHLPTSRNLRHALDQTTTLQKTKTTPFLRFSFGEVVEMTKKHIVNNPSSVTKKEYTNKHHLENCKLNSCFWFKSIIWKFIYQ